jgi:hypothetical protein
VLTRHAGWVRLDALETGAEVLAAAVADGALEWTPVIAWLHWEHRATASYVTITAAAHTTATGCNASRTTHGTASGDHADSDGVALTLSPMHYFHLSKAGCSAGWAGAALALPGEAAPGMGLWVLRDDAAGTVGVAALPAPDAAGSAGVALRCVPIAAVRAGSARGRFSPVTASSNVVVDGASASTLLRGGGWTALTGLPDATHGPSLRAIKRHHVITAALHRAFGQRGLDLLDALHAPLFRLLRVTQPTNGAVAAAQAAARAARQGSCDAATGGAAGSDEDAPPAADDLLPTQPGRVMRALSFALSCVVLIPTLMTA